MRATTAEMDPRARIDHASNLLRDRRFDEALVEYEWLWRNIPAEARELAGVRVSFMAKKMGLLRASSGRARDRFTELRRQAQSAAESTAELLSTPRFDWMVLNEVLDDTERTMGWFDGVNLLDTPPRRLSAFVYRLTPLLVERNRWADLGRLQTDPLANLRQSYEILDGALGRLHDGPSAVREAVNAGTRTVFRQQVSVLHRSLLAAGRGPEAALVHDEALRLDDSQELRALLSGAPS